MIRASILAFTFILLLVVLPWLLTADEPAATSPAGASGLPPTFHEKILTLPDKSTWKYVVYVPPQYEDDPDHRWPVILFLHGSGEIGTDNRRHTGVGLPAHIRRNPDKFPFIVVMPQAHSMWFRGANGAAAWGALDATLRDYRADPDRVYLTGLSMGGFGAWELAILQPNVFAAVVPICGEAPTEYLSNMVDVPVWAFHGSDDPNVPVSGSREAVKALKALGGKPKYTEYPNKGHKVWDEVYGSNQLYRWLLKQRRKPPPRVIDYRLLTPLARVWWLSARAEEGQERTARIRAEIGADGRIDVNTDGVLAWAIISDREPLKPGDEITLVLNDVEVYKGKFSGVLALNPTSRPADKENARPGNDDPSGDSPPEAHP